VFDDRLSRHLLFHSAQRLVMSVDLPQQLLDRFRRDRRRIFALAPFPALDGLVGGYRSSSALQAVGQVVALLSSDRLLDLGNSARMPSPVVLTMRPRRAAMVGSISLGGEPSAAAECRPRRRPSGGCSQLTPLC
jgi:hypothetical protein